MTTLMSSLLADTICAVATPAGRGGISVVRISGPEAFQLSQKIAGPLPAPGQYRLSSFRDEQHTPIDQGLVLAFRAPHSFTGEDVCELHTHGSPVVTDQILGLLIRLGARLANPGEFTERSFRNNRMDLVQAEAVADLINSNSVRAAQMAMRSLQGDFSDRINAIVDELINLRVYLEASLDFPDEDVELLDDGRTADRVRQLLDDLKLLRKRAQQGQIVQEGLKVVIAGEPNAGKSTLLNRLSGSSRAIVTDIPGTTRDILETTVVIDGISMLLLDTAGLRFSNDPVETEGIRRAWQAIRDSDHILYVVDTSSAESFTQNASWQQLQSDPSLHEKLSVVFSKIDRYGSSATLAEPTVPSMRVSALTGAGIAELQAHLLAKAGLADLSEGSFLARRRHLSGLDRGITGMGKAVDALSRDAAELVAEHLREVQDALGTITGHISQDDLLGMIFSSFCIGK